jgi:uncharacterized membrane protein
MDTDDLSNKSSGLQESSATHLFSHHVSVPADEGIRVDRGITIERPLSEVYSFWRHLENLPKFMRHVKSVKVLDELRSHWEVSTVGGKVVEWDAEMIEQRDNEMISWRSAPGADVDNAGSVWFTPTPGANATIVRVSLMYSPPGGKAAALAAKVFGRDAGSEIEEDLRRLKSLLETGEVPHESTMQDWQRHAVEVTQKAAQRADDYIRQNPWGLVGWAAVVGLVIGFILARPRPQRRCLED